MDPDIKVGFMFEHTYFEPLVIQKLDMRATWLVFQDVERICTTLRSIERWLDCSVNVKCDLATLKQLSMANQLWQVERNETACLEDKTYITF